MHAKKSISSFTGAAFLICFAAAGSAFAHPGAQAQSQQWFGPRDTIRIEAQRPYVVQPHVVQPYQPYMVQPQIVTGHSQYVIPDPRPVYYSASYYAQPYAPYYGPQYGAYYAPYYAPTYYPQPVYAAPLR